MTAQEQLEELRKSVEAHRDRSEELSKLAKRLKLNIAWSALDDCKDFAVWALDNLPKKLP